MAVALHAFDHFLVTDFLVLH